MASVLQVCTYFHPLGGIETAVRELVNGLKPHCETRVMCTRHGIGNTTEFIDGVSVKSVGGLISVKGRPLSISLPFELGKEKADIFHYHLPFPLATASHLIAPLSSKPTIISWHSDLIRYPLLQSCMKPLIQAFLDSAKAIVIPSQKILHTTEALIPHAEKCHVVPYGIDPHRLRLESPDRVNQIRREFGSPLILFAGRLVYYKGLDVLIRAMAQVDATLLVAGTGPLDSHLRELAVNLGLNNKVKFLGKLEDESLANFYHACDVFVLPSTSQAESFGLVQVEAMLCGKPVVNTAIPSAAPEVSIDHETGLTVPPGDVQALAAALNKLLGDKDLCRRFGEQGRSRALEHFTAKRYVDGIATIYDQVLAENTRSTYYFLSTANVLANENLCS